VASLSKLSQLRSLSLGAEKIEWSSELASSFRNGFKKLCDLSVSSSDLLLSTQHQVNPDKDGPKLRIRTLKLAWRNILPSGGTRPDIQLLSILDMTSLEILKLVDAACCPETLDWSIDCSNLVRLIVQFLPNQIRDRFSDLLAVLPRFSSLKILNITSTRANQLSTESPVPLSSVLARFPPTLLHLEADYLVFPDYGYLPLRKPSRLKRRETPFLSALRPSRSNPGTNVKLTVWKRIEEGNVCWYRKGKPELQSGAQCESSPSRFVAAVRTYDLGILHREELADFVRRCNLSPIPLIPHCRTLASTPYSTPLRDPLSSSASRHLSSFYLCYDRTFRKV
jgi:hypothetical protein